MTDFDKMYDEWENRYADQTVTPEFDSSGQAYDRCNSDEHMHTGRVFIVESEKIVGIAWAWPIAVTQESGQLHTSTTDPRSWDDEPAISASVETAINLAKSKGWPLAPWAQE